MKFILKYRCMLCFVLFFFSAFYVLDAVLVYELF